MRRWIFFFCLLACMAGADEPHIGYCFPSGGQQGRSFEAMIGGQYLMGEVSSTVNGEGVSIEVLDYFIEVDQKSFGGMTRRVKNLEAQIEEAKQKGDDLTKLAVQLEKAHADVAMQEKVIAEMKKKYTPADLKELKKKRQFNPQIAEVLKVRITIAKDAPEGERELRVRTERGLSNPIVFCVGTLNEVVEVEPNDDNHAVTLQQVQLPVLINGQVMPGDIDCFRFEARQGQSLVIDVSARRLIPYLADAVPGWFQAVIVLYDEDGNEVAMTDDYKFSPDPVLFYDVPKNGVYTLEIKDAIYRGREDFIYRISAGELPFITSIFPLGARQDEEVDLFLRGKNLLKNRLTGRLPVADYTEVRQITVKNGVHRSNPVPFAINVLPEAFEVEPNDTVEQAQPVTLPLIINGRIQQPGDRDVFRFSGKAGEVFSINVHARRLSSPLDSIIRLTGPGLENPIVSDDYVNSDAGFLFLGAGLSTHHADSYLLFELTETGIFYVDLGDAQSKGGDDFSYRLHLGPAAPDFGLRLEPSGVNIAPGGTAVFTVIAQREDGFNGEITLDVANLPEGFVMSKAAIPPGEDTVRFTLTAPRDLKPMKVTPEIKGVGVINGVSAVRKVVPVDDQMQAFLYRHLVPSQEVVLVPSQKPSPVSFAVVLPESGVIKLPVNQAVRLNLTGLFVGGLKGVSLALDHPPAGVSVVKGWLGPAKKPEKQTGEKRFDPNEATGSIVLKVDETVKPGFKTSLVINAVIKRGKEEFLYPAPAIQIEVVAAE